MNFSASSYGDDCTAKMSKCKFCVKILNYYLQNYHPRSNCRPWVAHCVACARKGDPGSIPGEIDLGNELF